MSGSTFSVQLPQPNAPFFDPNGGLSVIWLNWFLAIQNRTGGTPGIPAAGLQAQIISLFVEQAMADTQDPQEFQGLAMDTVMSEPAPIPSVGALILAMTGDPDQAKVVNPFLAGMVVGDVV